jgi:hypothetical protein
LLAALELEHHPPQELVELSPFPVGERGRHERLLGRLRADGVLPRSTAAIGHLHQDAATVVRVRDAADEAGLLEPVEPVRHRTARELGPLGELPRRAPVRRARLPQVAEHLPLPVREAELGEGLVERVVKALGQASDSLDDPFDLEIEARQLRPELLEKAVDMVTLLSGLRHGT